MQQSWGEAGVAEHSWDGIIGVPSLLLALIRQYLRISMKQKLIEGLGRVFTEITGTSDWSPIVYTREHSYLNIGGSGI